MRARYPHRAAIGVDGRASARRWRDAANDRAPREKRSPILRFANAMGKTQTGIYLASLLGYGVASAVGSASAAWAFLGGAIGATTTLCIISIVERRLS